MPLSPGERGGVMQSDDIDRVFLLSIWYLEGFRVFEKKKNSSPQSSNASVRGYQGSVCSSAPIIMI